jgi:hypothetical protein
MSHTLVNARTGGFHPESFAGWFSTSEWLNTTTNCADNSFEINVFSGD